MIDDRMTTSESGLFSFPTPPVTRLSMTDSLSPAIHPSTFPINNPFLSQSVPAGKHPSVYSSDGRRLRDMSVQPLRETRWTLMDKRFLSTGAVSLFVSPPPQRPVTPGAPLHHVSPQMEKKAQSQHLTPFLSIQSARQLLKRDDE